jgi:hypothetical protein
MKNVCVRGPESLAKAGRWDSCTAAGRAPVRRLEDVGWWLMRIGCSPGGRDAGPDRSRSFAPRLAADQHLPRGAAPRSDRRPLRFDGATPDDGEIRCGCATNQGRTHDQAPALFRDAAERRRRRRQRFVRREVIWARQSAGRHWRLPGLPSRQQKARPPPKVARLLPPMLRNIKCPLPPVAVGTPAVCRLQNSSVY